MRRWKKGIAGAVSMGTYHGMYCLGCCWPYFLIMVALGWMDILWMALFAGIIFGEKIWSKGIWVARIAGIALAVAGVLSIAQVVTVVPSHDAMSMPGDTSMSGDSPQEPPMEMPPAESTGQEPLEESRMPDEGQPGMKM
jgi:hypothetical protein